MDTPAPEAPPQPRRRSSLIPLGIMGLMLVAGLVMLWRGSLRRNLSDDELTHYLDAAAGDRDTYHAAEEISRRIGAKDAGRKQFYPMVIALGSSPLAEKRKVVAWLMGEDPAEETFRAPLLKLIDDRVPIVAHNAALALARHGSDAGHAVLLSMLQPSAVVAPADGIFHPKVKIAETADIRSPLATIQDPYGDYPVDTPVPGRVLTLTSDGTRVSRGETVATLSAAQAFGLEALRALTLPGIGRPEDAAVIEAFLKATPDLEKQVQEQAKETLLAINRVR
jgi:hypothetical protein